MRALHRDVGFFLVGLATIYSVSGIVLVYRDTDFLKREKQVEKQLKPGMSEDELGRELRMREFAVSTRDGDVLYFNEGSYNVSSGMAIYTTKELPVLMTKIISLHKTASKSAVHWITTIFGILLLFLAISSFWMFKMGSKSFKRGLYFASAGVVFIIILLVV
jgi:hypothetical protein